MPLCTLISLPLYLYPKVSLLDLMIVLFLILWGFSVLFSMMTIVICKCVQQLFFWISLPMLVILVMKISAIQCLYLRINIGYLCYPMGSTDYMQIPSKILMSFYHRNRKINLQIHIQVLKCDLGTPEMVSQEKSGGIILLTFKNCKVSMIHIAWWGW